MINNDTVIESQGPGSCIVYKVILHRVMMQFGHVQPLGADGPDEVGKG